MGVRLNKPVCMDETVTRLLSGLLPILHGEQHITFLLPYCAHQLAADQVVLPWKMSLLLSNVLVRVQPHLLPHHTVPVAQPASPAITGGEPHAH